MAEPLRLRGDKDPARVHAVLDQVNWLTRATRTSAPDPDDLGPKYTVVVFAGDVAKQKYDLYPLAKGGPRAYRPARQPNRTITAVWYLGRINMSEALRGVGVPLEKQPDALSGGIGGGEQGVDEPVGPTEDLDQLFADLRRMLLLNVGLIVLITAGLAGISLLIRRRTR